MAKMAQKLEDTPDCCCDPPPIENEGRVMCDTCRGKVVVAEVEAIDILKYLPRIDDGAKFEQIMKEIKSSLVAWRKELQNTFEPLIETFNSVYQFISFIRKFTLVIKTFKVGHDNLIKYFGDDRFTSPVLRKLATILSGHLRTLCLFLDGPELIATLFDLCCQVVLILLMVYIMGKQLSQCFGKDKEKAWRQFCAAKRTVKNHVEENTEVYKKIARLLFQLCGSVYLFDIACYFLSCDTAAQKSQLVLWINQNPIATLGIGATLCYAVYRFALWFSGQSDGDDKKGN